MASIKKRMNRRWKGVPWIDTPFAVPFKIAAMKRARAISVISQGICRIHAIRSAEAASPLQKAGKKMAVASAVIGTCKGVMEIYK